MADNVTIDTVTYAADDIDNVLYPRVKVTWGANNTANDASAANPLPVDVVETIADGAVFTINTTPVFPSGYVQRATPTTHANGDVGAARMTERQAVITAPDWSLVTLTNTTPVPSGSDIVAANGAALASTDFAIRDNAAHDIFIPMFAWRRLRVTLTNDAIGFDQAIAVSIRTTIGLSSTGPGEIVAAWNHAIGSSASYGFGTAGALGQGGTAGGATAATRVFYSIPAASDCHYVQIKLTAATAPTTGNLTVSIWRSS